jgi:RimJ/RimL family protein N-acetyltransferase
MVRTLDGRTVGAVSWRTIEYPGSFEIGVMVGDAERWGSGYGIEAELLLLEYLFDSLNAHRVQFTCGVFNKLAVSTFTSGPIRIEGVMRDYYFLDGTYHDAIFGSMLRNEYYNFMPPRESVAAAEKEEAMAMLRDYMAKNPVTMAMDRGSGNGE